MSKELVISAASHERRVAILEEGQLVEIYIEREKEFALVGSIYKGKVTRVLPGMQSAFVDIGLDGDAFLYVSDVFENLDDYDHGHGHTDAAAAPIRPPIAGGTPVDVLPGEVRSVSRVHEEIVSLDDGHENEPRLLHGVDHSTEESPELHDEEAQPRDFAPHAEGEPADPDERQPESNASAPQNFGPNYNPTRNYPPRGGSDRGPSFDRGNDRGGDRGGDRGRGGRRGRVGRRRGASGGSSGGRPPGQGGRNLPPSKYASPQGDRENRGYESRPPENRTFETRRPIDRGPAAPVDKAEDDIVLPGESLAKYRARPAQPVIQPVVEHEPEERQPDFEEKPGRLAVGMQTTAGTPRRFSGSLPHWVLADNEAEAAQAGETTSEESSSEAAENAALAAETETLHEEEASTEPQRSGTAGMSDDDIAALSARLMEAKQEETQARAESDSLSGGAVFEDEEEEDEEEIDAEEAHEDELQEVRESEQQLHDDHHDAQHHDDKHHEELHGEDHHDEHHEDHHGEHEADETMQRHEEEPAELTPAERADLAHEEALEHVASESVETISAGSTAIPEEDVILLPGETRTPRDPNAPHEEFIRRDSARIGSNPRSRFQRPMRGGRDRGDRGGFRGRSGRPDSRHDRGDRGPDRGPERGPERGSDRGPDRGSDRGPSRGPDRGGDRGRGRFERRGGPGHSRGHHGGHAPQRRPQLISEMLKAGQDIVVQIAKEPLGKKGARITSHVALPGRFLVYMPTIDHIGVSRKIDSADNRSRLRRLVGEARGSYPGGFIVRTDAGEATDEEIRTDIDFLGKTWNEIKQKHEERKAPALLHRDLNLVERILRDYVSDDFTGIWIDNEEEYGKVVEFVSRFQPKLVNKVKLYTKEQPIFEEFGIQHELYKALRAKVWLKSGGYIVINHTEALVAIDVNTGKFVGKGSTRLEDTIVKTNLEAVKEIVRQIRLRDLGGIIVVDFIDMEERRNREKVLMALQQALEEDKAPSKALSFNEFGLVCITRKRTKQALERVLCQPCPYCTGSGMVKSIPTLCYEIQAEARKMAIATAENEAPNLTLRVHPEIAKALKTRESMLIDELEQTTHEHIIIQSDATLHWEQYDIC